MKLRLMKRMLWSHTFVLIAVSFIQNAVGQSNYASHANNVDYLGKGLPEEATLDGKVSFFFLSPILLAYWNDWIKKEYGKIFYQPLALPAIWILLTHVTAFSVQFFCMNVCISLCVSYAVTWIVTFCKQHWKILRSRKTSVLREITC